VTEREFARRPSAAVVFAPRQRCYLAGEHKGVVLYSQVLIGHRLGVHKLAARRMLSSAGAAT
jgi:hypothetical protein